MTLDQFSHLSPFAQLLAVQTEGTYLTQHREQGRGLVKLYHLFDGGAGLFVEVGYDERQREAVVLRSFTNAARLADYAQGVPLPSMP